MLHCSFENGNTASLRHVTVDAILIKDEKVLLVKRNGKLLEGGKWALVGGYVERDETVKQAVTREALEETGYQIDSVILLTIRDNPDRPKEDRQNISFVFFCAATEKVGESDWEVDDQKWFAFDQLPPAAEIAFDHYQNIQLYKKYINEKMSLPII